MGDARFFRVSDVGRGFDGLIVEGQTFLIDNMYDTSSDCGNSPDSDVSLFSVERVFDTAQVVGDRVVSTPVDGVYILRSKLTECDDPRKREFDASNPWGRCLYEQHYVKGKMHVDCAQFQLALQVTVREVDKKLPSKTLYSEYFRDDEYAGSTFSQVKEAIECVLEDGDEDELVFELKRVKKGQN